MIGKKITEFKYITIPEAKKVLDKRAKIGELGYEQRLAREYLTEFSRINEKDAKKLAEKLKKTEKLSEIAVVKIIDLLPKDEDELRVILQKERYSLEKTEVEAVLSAVKDTLGAKAEN
ncbi:MAG: DNA-directed RNA polymerase subunit F [Candidatus Diapherotrites archaeon]|nr:DNA-directed RNA polymerase subunit F [Candidatus Diapherotrites archaeon]